MDSVDIIGIDISKRCFQLYGVTASGIPVLRKKLPRSPFTRTYLKTGTRDDDLSHRHNDSLTLQIFDSLHEARMPYARWCGRGEAVRFLLSRLGDTGSSLSHAFRTSADGSPLHGKLPARATSPSSRQAPSSGLKAKRAIEGAGGVPESTARPPVDCGCSRMCAVSTPCCSVSRRM